MVEIDINPILFTADFLFSLALSWHGFFSFVAVSTAVVLVGRWAPLREIDPDAVYSIAIWAILGGIVGARLVHVIDNWEIYKDAPGSILGFRGIAIWGGVLGGLAGGIAAARVMKQPVGVIADLTAPALLFVLSIGRLGDIINGEHCSKATDFFLSFKWTHPETVARICPDGFTSDVHPAIAYEMLWLSIALAAVWWLRGRLRPDGMVFVLFLAAYALGRFLTMFLREGVDTYALGLVQAQLIALLVLVVTVPLLVVKARLVGVAEGIPLMTRRGTRAERRRRGGR